MALLELFESEAMPLLHQVDEPEVARAQRHHLLLCDGASAAGIGAGGSAAGRLLDGVFDRGLGLVAISAAGDRAALDRALDQLAEVIAVALLEGGALGLAVV